LRALPFVLAAAVSAALILAAPFIGEVRRAILARFPGQFGRIIGAIVLLTVAAAVVAALTRIRDRRGWRYLGLAAGYSLATRTGDPTVDAVEHFHFVEYGLVTLLFYRAWRPAGDLSTLVLPVLAGLLVGTLEEWFQWFIPARVGDVWDIFLNGVAIACGLIFSVSMDPPERLAMRIPAASVRRIGAFAAVVLVAFAAFFQSVHLGHLVSGDGWRFRSGHTGAALDVLSADRAARWRGTFVGRPARLSAEDQYATEGHWHVQRRNRAWDAKDVRTAWLENAILERYFAPVLDTPSYVAKTGHRWGPEHRADAERQFRELPAGEPYESDAQAGAIHLWPRPLYWTLVLACAALLAGPWVLGRPRRGGSTSGVVAMP
jgi:VanZ family protein